MQTVLLIASVARVVKTFIFTAPQRKTLKPRKHAIPDTMLLLFLKSVLN